MPDVESLRMNETRRVEKRSGLERLGDALRDDLDLFVETGSSDRSMCNDMRVHMSKVKVKWEEVSKDFKQLLATMVEGDVREKTLQVQESYRNAYMGGIKKAGEATAELFNTMETERLDREARGGGGGQAGAGLGTGRGAPPRVDESLCPEFKASYALSLNEFNHWQEMAVAWGLASVHEQRLTLHGVVTLANW